MAKGFNRAALVALLVALPVAIGSGAAAASSPRMVRVGAAPRVPAGARSLGAVSSSAPLSGTVVLKPRDNAALVQFINAVSNPSSRLFHQYLPAGAFAGRFGPTDGNDRRACARNWPPTACASPVCRATACWSTSPGAPPRSRTAFQTGVERYRLRRRLDRPDDHLRRDAAVGGRRIGGRAVLGLNDLVRATPAAIVRAPASDRGRSAAPGRPRSRTRAGAPTPARPRPATRSSSAG